MTADDPAYAVTVTLTTVHRGKSAAAVIRDVREGLTLNLPDCTVLRVVAVKAGEDGNTWNTGTLSQ